MLQHDRKPRLIEGFHDNRTHSLVVGKEVEGGEEEEEAESQSEGKTERREMEVDDIKDRNVNESDSLPEQDYID